MAKTLLGALIEFRKKDRISLHMPGHKHGAGLSGRLKKYGYSIDITEFDETDNLQAPAGILKEAQERTAAAFGAGESFFLTGGSTLGLHAAVLGSTKPGDTLLVDRTCHRAVIAALVMGGVKPHFIYPAFDEELGVYRGITGRTVKRALDACPEAVGALVTSPSYYGVCADIWGIAACLHNSGKFLIVDEAHGAHFAFSPRLPRPALWQGADICVQSLHKTLPALGQTALLHMGRSACVSARRVERQLRILQTTSPSYLLMASMDEAVSEMERHGEKKLANLLSALERLKGRIRRRTRLTVMDENALCGAQDPLRLAVDFRETGLSGIEAGELLKETFGIYPEMADHRYVVFIVTASNTKEELEQLEDALFALGTTRFAGEGHPENIPLLPIEMACLPAEAWYGDRRRVPAEQAAGKVCAEIVGVCPPGAALLVPGQRVDAETAEYIEKNQGIETVEILTDR